MYLNYPILYLKTFFPCVVAAFSQEKIAPLVLQMDKDGAFDPSVISGLFEQGVSCDTYFLE